MKESGQYDSNRAMKIYLVKSTPTQEPKSINENITILEDPQMLHRDRLSCST